LNQISNIQPSIYMNVYPRQAPVTGLDLSLSQEETAQKRLMTDDVEAIGLEKRWTDARGW
jgi:hypothetical protein